MAGSFATGLQPESVSVSSDFLLALAGCAARRAPGYGCPAAPPSEAVHRSDQPPSARPPCCPPFPAAPHAHSDHVDRSLMMSYSLAQRRLLRRGQIRG